jgi:hypothetical protein
VKNCLLTALLLCVATWASAQFPDINVVQVRGRNFVTFKNQYDKLQRIEIQRSNDSTKGYVTIGVINNPKKGDGTYADERPMLGRNHYQLRIVFSEDMDWYSKRKSVTVDSANITTAATTEMPRADEVAPPVASPGEAVVPEFAFAASTRVFTNSYTGHINIELEGTLEKRYSLVFYDYKDNEAVRIDRVSKDRVILDKHNFNGTGVYRFVLKESGNQVETGYVRIN